VVATTQRERVSVRAPTALTGGGYPAAPDDELVTNLPVSDASMTVTTLPTRIQERTIETVKEIR